MKQGDVRVVIHGSRFTDVETSKRQFRFYSNHASYCEYPTKKYAESSWCFDVEEKLYLTSNHCTKISFYAVEGEREQTEKRILEFIDKIMASIKPIPRFTLSRSTGGQRYLDLMKPGEGK